MDLPGPASIDLICLPVSKSQRRIWASRELDAAMEPVWLISTDTTPSWWPSNVHCRFNFSPFLLLKGKKRPVMNSWRYLTEIQPQIKQINKLTHTSQFLSTNRSNHGKWGQLCTNCSLYSKERNNKSFIVFLKSMYFILSLQGVPQKSPSHSSIWLLAQQTQSASTTWNND